MRKLLRYILLFLLLVLALIFIGGVLFYNDITLGPIPQHDGEITVAGLSEDVEIIRDSWGVPHIYASTSYDLLFAQGYTQAQDRWWQMEFSRHIGRGAIQELTGQNASAFETDLFIHKLGLLQAAERDFAAYSEDTKAILQAFADGVNAYILNRPARYLAMEYTLLGVTGVSIEIAPWTPVDTIVWAKVMALQLDGNRNAELLRSDLLGSYDAEFVEAFFPEFPFDSKPSVVTEADLPIGAESAGGTPPVSAGGIVGLSRERVGDFNLDGVFVPQDAGLGSNNWVVAGGKTATGTPLLANDPHLGIQMPSIWYEIGLHCREVSAACPYNLVGFSFAPSPLIIIGHNERIAWGVTTSNVDTQDLYLIKVNPNNPLQYEWNGEMRDMTTREETINFGDGVPAVTFTVRETHLGPIINDNALVEDGSLSGYNNTDPLALQWAALTETGSLMDAVIGLGTASNWAEFRAALSFWDSPSQNFVYGDIDGNIGYQLPGRVPVRATGHIGNLPMDASTDQYEWRGYVPFDLMPRIYNPARNYIATANQAFAPPTYFSQLGASLPAEFGEAPQAQFSFEWDYGYRGQRIVELLEASDEHSIATFQAMHGDNKFVFAEELAPFLAALDFGDSALNAARDWLLDWDLQMNADSPQGALMIVLWGRLLDNLYVDQLGEFGTPNSRDKGMWTTTTLLNTPESAWWDDTTTDAVETRDDILIRSFSEAHAQLVEQFGADRSTWRYGELHTSTFVSNPLGLSGIDVIENIVNRGGYPTGGGGAIVNATGWANPVEGDFTVAAVPSLRMIVDLGNFENSLSMHTTGQSGHPRSPQYDNMIQAWVNVEYHPMLWTREQVEAAQSNRLVLKPSN